MEYDLIVADPAWRYEFSRSNSRRIENQYPTMSLEEIKSLRIPAADNAALFLWGTAPKLPEALEVMTAWEFIYKTCAVWDKKKIGMGYWFRGRHELILVGVRGKFSPPPTHIRIPSVIEAVRTRHSRKPSVLMKYLENAYPEARKLEMFSREAREGWDSWGNELQSGVQIV